MTIVLFAAAFVFVLLALIVLGLKYIAWSNRQFSRELARRQHIERMKWYNGLRDESEE